MNRHERRRATKNDFTMTKEKAHAFGEQGRVTKDACAFEVRVVRQLALFNAITNGESSILGGVSVKSLATTIAKWLVASAESIPGKGPQCLACETEFSKTVLPRDFIFMTPANPVPRDALVMSICDHCAERSDDELFRIGMAKVKEVWTDAYEAPFGGGPH